MGLGWYVADRIVEPRLSGIEVDGDLAEAPTLDTLSRAERRGLWAGLMRHGAGHRRAGCPSMPAGSAWRAPSGELAASAAPLMQSIVPLIFLFFLLPGVVYGYVAGTVKTHRDIVAGMTHAMSGMGYYIVMAFFASLFIAEFGRSNLGALFALQGAACLAARPPPCRRVR
jgi:aminobenzoyl-glutamate transport protein